MRQVIARTHPDVTVLRTEQVIIRIDEARQLVERAYFAPSLLWAGCGLQHTYYQIPVERLLFFEIWCNSIAFQRRPLQLPE